MSFWESIWIALEGLAANKMRSALTMLGVVIGVGAVIVIYAITTGAQQQEMERIEKMGTNVLTIRGGRSRGSSLKMADVEALQKGCETMLRIAPSVQTNQQVKYGSNSASVSIYGITPDYMVVRNYQVAEGRNIAMEDDRGLKKVAVLGPTTAETLFEGQSAIGQMIRLRGLQFEVVGVTVAKGGGNMFMDPDDIVFIPLTTAMKRVSRTDRLREIALEAPSADATSVLYEEADRVMGKLHPPNALNEAQYMLVSSQDILAARQESTKTFAALLISVAIVSLLVGGIGIMNIMLVSVTERTREIGIRMAVGARRKDLLRQFLVESLVLSLLGGLLGVALGAAASWIVAIPTGWKMTISPVAVVTSFTFSAIVGLVFGIYPAMKASALDPIEALRYE